MLESFPSSFDLRVKSYSLINDFTALENTPLNDVQELVSGIESICTFTVDQETATQWHFLSVSILILKRLDLWLKGKKEADIHAKAHKESVEIILDEELASGNIPDNWLCILEDAENVSNRSDLKDLCLQISRIPMPLCEKSKDPSYPRSNLKNIIPEKPQLAFVNFRIDGKPAKNIETLKAEVTYDLEIDLRLNSWPQNALTLLLTPLSIEPHSTFTLPTFEIHKDQSREEKDGSFRFNKKGRMIIHNPQSLAARPYEFNYSADFEPSDHYSSFDVIGHRSLRLEGIDLSSSPISGFQNIDRKIFEVRQWLRSVNRLSQDTMVSSLRLLAALGGVSQQALSDSSFSSDMDEGDFQKELIKRLRANPSVGEKLEVHPSVGGGIADLSFDRIRLELKVDYNGGDYSSREDKNILQAHQYSVASGKECCILCTLRRADQKQVSARAEDMIKFRTLEDGTIIFLVNMLCDLPRPSDLSR